MPDSNQSAGDSIPDQPAAWRGLIASLLKYLEARGLLARLEAQDALTQLIWVAVFAILACILAFGAWLLAVPAFVWIVCQKMHWEWSHAFLVTGLIHLVLAAIFVKGMINRVRGAKWFAESLDQFKKDRTWILRHSEKS